jgi:hypothetical protein
MHGEGNHKKRDDPHPIKDITKQAPQLRSYLLALLAR